MAALFACTKCHSRHPFEDLTKSEQLCKKCRRYQPVVKCTMCRVEFTPGEKGSMNNNCRHCTSNLRTYGQPVVCQYCNLTAAFVDNKCMRCTLYEKKFGKPRPCEQCKMKCAFESETSRKKVDGKLLCWLCTLAYERVMEKARQKQGEKMQGIKCNPSSYDKLEKSDKVENISICSNTNSSIRFSPFDTTNSQCGMTAQKDTKPISITVSEAQNKSTPTSFASSFDFLRENKEDKSMNSSDVKVKDECAMEKDHNHKHHNHHHHHKSKQRKSSHSPCSPSKRPKLENSDSNGITGSQTPTKTVTLSVDKSQVDPNSSEHMIAINRLHEQLDILKKQLALKDQQLLDKEKKITEVKAAQYESEKSFRAKLTEMAKQNVESVDLIQVRSNELEKKNRDLKKQVELLTKSKKLNSQSYGRISSPSLST